MRKANKVITSPLAHQELAYFISTSSKTHPRLGNKIDSVNQHMNHVQSARITPWACPQHRAERSLLLPEI